MSKPKKRAKLVDRMVSLAVAEGYAGLDLDFEKFAFNDGSSTWAATRPNWVQFVKELGTALHAHGKELAATTPPLCSMGGACGGRNGYWVYDRKGIAPYVDRLRIMAYDYSWSVPGPIGPYPWAEAIVAGRDAGPQRQGAARGPDVRPGVGSAATRTAATRSRAPARRTARCRATT